eukprot:TRINITY_DN11087_c0_g1_i1.p1 TRINITY_DN11087_c0_g1~~TRINITY_DN11087_c0_g1_i1.p1  ORF type:complete len:744 (+),score=146.97 TRINITY_DN11087_c0_g1_i1:98-2329(+)
MSHKKKRHNAQFYAVTNGRKIGICTTWNEASGSVIGFHGAANKSYDCLKKAKEAMMQSGIVNPPVYGDTKDEEDKDTETEEEQIDEVEEEEEKEKEEENLKFGPSVYSATCPCGTNMEGRSLKCNECQRKVHLACTSLPDYQVCVFASSCRKVTCQACAEAHFMSESTMVEIQKQKKIINDAHQSKTSPVSTMMQNKAKTSTEAQIIDIKTMVCNLEKAIHNIAEQTHSSFLEMREHFELAVQNNKCSQSTTELNITSSNKTQNSSDAKDTVRSSQVIPEDLLNRSIELSGASCQRKHRTPKKKSNAQYETAARKQKDNNRDSTKKKIQKDQTRSNVGKDTSTNALVSNEDKQEDSNSNTNDETMLSSSVEEEETHGDHNNLPYVLILHDSVLNDVDARRLGNSYGLSVKKKIMHKLEDEENMLEKTKATPDAILLHCGINNLKNETAKSASLKMTQIVQNIRKDMGETDIVVSQAIPSGDDELEAKRKLYNALVFSELYTDGKVSFLDYNMRPHNKIMYRDAIHPSVRGSSFLASNIGRHLEGRLWQRQKKYRPRPKFGKKLDRHREGPHRQEQEKEKQQVQNTNFNAPSETYADTTDRSRNWRQGSRGNIQEGRDYTQWSSRHNDIHGHTRRYGHRVFQYGGQQKPEYDDEHRYTRKASLQTNKWGGKYYWENDRQNNRRRWSLHNEEDGQKTSDGRYDYLQNDPRQPKRLNHQTAQNWRPSQGYGWRRPAQDWRPYIPRA